MDEKKIAANIGIWYFANELNWWEDLSQGTANKWRHFWGEGGDKPKSDNKFIGRKGGGVRPT